MTNKVKRNAKKGDKAFATAFNKAVLSKEELIKFLSDSFSSRGEKEPVKKVEAELRANFNRRYKDSENEIKIYRDKLDSVTKTNSNTIPSNEKTSFDSLIKKIVQDTIKETLHSMNLKIPTISEAPTIEINSIRRIPKLPFIEPSVEKQMRMKETINDIHSVISNENSSYTYKIASILKIIDKANEREKFIEKKKSKDINSKDNCTIDILSEPTGEEELLNLIIDKDLRDVVHNVYPNESAAAKDFASHIDLKSLAERIPKAKKASGKRKK